MTEEQKKLEELLLKHIDNQVAGALNEADTVSETALALIDLWRLEKLQAMNKHLESFQEQNSKTGRVPYGRSYHVNPKLHCKDQ